MKKRRLLIPFLALLCLLLALALASCGEESDHTHVYGEWVETLAPTCVARGIEMRVCDCGHSETQYIDIDTTAHVSANTWTSDSTGHWYECTHAGCGQKVNEAAHAPATAWTTDATNHWKVCTVCGYDSTPTAHTYDAENTCACQHYKDAGVTFTLQSGTYTVTAYTGTATEVIIPSKYNGVAVTAIGSSAFQNCSSLTTITIPASVTSIGDYAFSACYKLIEVYNLSSLNITAGSSSNGYVGAYAKDIYTTATAQSKQFTDSDGYLFYDDGTYRCLFGYTGDSTALTLPASCKGNNYEIYQYAFYKRDDLTSVTIPANVTSIGTMAFYNCSSLTTITIPASVTSIGYGAFNDCSSLTSVTFENPNGWWRASYFTSTSGTDIPAADLSDSATAATYLKSTYREYYWKRS